MNSVTGSEEIILNDTFETQRTSPYNLLLASNNTNEKLSVIDGKETMSFNVDNVHRITWQAGEKDSFGTYEYTPEYPTPVKQLILGLNSSEKPESGKVNEYPNPNDWNLIYSYYDLIDWETKPNGFELASIFDLNPEKNKVLCEAYPGLKNSIFINRGTSKALIYFFKEIKEGSDDDLRIKATGIGSCTFTIGLLPLILYSDLSEDGSSPVLGKVKLKDGVTEAKSINDFYGSSVTSYFKTRVAEQTNFISFGNYSKDGSGAANDKFRFVLAFRTIYSQSTDSWEVRVYDNFTIYSGYNNYEIYRFDGEDGRIRWDGLTLQKFKCYYEPTDADGSFASIKGRLYLINENGEEIFLAENIRKTNDTMASLPNSPNFGAYTINGYTCLAISQFEFTANINDSYEFTLDSTPYFFTPFYDKLKNEMTYAVSGATTADVNWKFINGQNTNDIQTTGQITISDNWISRNNITAVDYFGKKNKEIVITADTGTITSFTNPSKKITSIDISQLTGITTLDLSDNLLQFIDLTSNSTLSEVNLSFNKKLKRLILPATLTPVEITIDVSNCPVLESIMIPSGDFSGKTININLTNTPNIKCIEFNNTGSSTAYLNILTNGTKSKLEKLTLHNVSIADLSSLNLENFFKELHAINISESALLTNKDNLETFLNLLPDRTGFTAGKIYLYGSKYTYDGVKGSTSAISSTLANLKNKNWLFYV